MIYTQTELKPWMVMYRAEDSPGWTKIGTYQSRFEAENHANHIKTKVLGKLSIMWSGTND